MQEEVVHLKAFHTVHFPGQRIPDISPNRRSEPASDTVPDSNSDGLGFYTDGVKRTLTDEQIKLFRHSEIQRLLSERRQARREAEEAQEQAEYHEEERARKRKFYDDVSQQQDKVRDLSYDEPAEPNESTANEKKFLWPKLGA